MRVNEVRGVVCGLVVSALASGAPAFAQAVAGPKQGEESGASRLESLLARRPVVKQALTLEQAVAIALRESPVVRGAREEVEAANGRLRAARAETRPWLSLNTFASGGSNANIVASPTVVQPQMITALPRDAFLDQNLMLMFPLSTGGRLGAMTRQAAALRDASSSDVLTQQQEVALLTRMAIGKSRRVRP
jgi:outer membrane protein TolC